MDEIREWIIPLIVALSAVGSVVGVYYGIKTNRRIARQRATLDFANAYNDDERVSEGYKVIYNHNGQEPLKSYLEKGGKNREHFLLLMNKFEILAAGLSAGIYDQEMVDNIFGTEMRDIFDKAEPMVNHIRDNENEDIFSNMEKMTGRYFS